MDEKPMLTVKERMRIQKERAKRRKRIASAILISIMMLTALTIIFVNSPFFAVKEIQVENTGTHVPASDIEAAAGIFCGDLIWRVDKQRTENAVYQIPWIQSVTVKRKLPSRVVISVTEGEIAAYISFDGGWMAVDETAKTIALCDASADRQGCPVFTGLQIEMPPVGAKLAITEEQQAMIEQFLAQKESLTKVDTICIENPAQVDMVLYSGMTVKLGDCSNLSYKLSTLQEVLGQMSADATGVLDLRMDNGRVSYRRIEEQTPPPAEEEQTEVAEISASEAAE